MLQKSSFEYDEPSTGYALSIFFSKISINEFKVLIFCNFINKCIKIVSKIQNMGECLQICKKEVYNSIIFMKFQLK